MEEDKQIPIWFFIGALMALYGIIIAIYSFATWSQPPPGNMPAEIHKLHAGTWWGVLMTLLGLFYVVRFRPRSGESITGERTEPGKPASNPTNDRTRGPG